MNRIAKGLKKLFEKHRIIFWYDNKKELQSLSLFNIDSIES